MRMRLTLTITALLFLINAAMVMAASSLKQIGEFVVPEANQGVGVDDRYFYAVDNQKIAKYEKKTGRLVKKWQGEKNGPIVHLDSAMLLDGKIYCAHSNYNEWPMTSSVEIWNADTMEHIGNHSFGINWGSLTWVDFYNGHWWMTFANYDRPFGPGKTPYGHKVTTQMVKFSADFKYLESWVLPKAILDRFEEMSNSGGSWGPDGYLYLSGHDPAEIYRMRLPKAGSVLELVDVIPMNIRGQGIAWDRSERGVIYGIIRATAKEKAAGGNHKVTISKLVDAP
ncbi:MAG: cycloisomerase [Deltaproteobacteria bacterium]|nr:MAG: cycloisomerase [Deltaproteobacteria bacterium]